MLECPWPCGGGWWVPLGWWVSRCRGWVGLACLAPPLLCSAWPHTPAAETHTSHQPKTCQTPSFPWHLAPEFKKFPQAAHRAAASTSLARVCLKTPPKVKEHSSSKKGVLGAKATMGELPPHRISGRSDNLCKRATGIPNFGLGAKRPNHTTTRTPTTNRDTHAQTDDCITTHDQRGHRTPKMAPTYAQTHLQPSSCGHGV